MSVACVVLFWAGVDHPRSLSEQRTDWPSTRYALCLQDQSKSPPFMQVIILSMLHRPLRIPLSAFVVEDMNELVRAHATYRFILCDEEDEKPRLLVCLEHAGSHWDAHTNPQ